MDHLCGGRDHRLGLTQSLVVSVLIDDLAAVEAAGTVTDWRTAVNAWLVDATGILDNVHNNLNNTSDILDNVHQILLDVRQRFLQLEANALTAGIAWNPRRLSELASQGINPNR